MSAHFVHMWPQNRSAVFGWKSQKDGGRGARRARRGCPCSATCRRSERVRGRSHPGAFKEMSRSPGWWQRCRNRSGHRRGLQEQRRGPGGPASQHGQEGGREGPQTPPQRSPSSGVFTSTESRVDSCGSHLVFGAGLQRGQPSCKENHFTGPIRSCTTLVKSLWSVRHKCTN